MKSVRGLVFSGPMMYTLYPEQPEKLTYSVIPRLDPQHLRSNLLFWDKLVYPISLEPIFNIGTESAETDFLIDAGVLTRPTPAPLSILGPRLHINGYLSVFRKLDVKEPGQWSLAVDEAMQDLILKDQTEPMTGAQIALYNCIPVPDQDVPLAEILEFKEKRSNELLAFRHHLERVSQQVAKAADHARSLKTETEALDKAIADQLKVAKECKFKLKLGSLGGKFNVTSGLIAGLSAFKSGLSITESVLAGAAVSLVPKVELEISGGLRAAKASGTPYQYIISYHSELFRSL
jgi:hypothetical protein